MAKDWSKYLRTTENGYELDCQTPGCGSTFYHLTDDRNDAAEESAIFGAEEFGFAEIEDLMDTVIVCDDCFEKAKAQGEDWWAKGPLI